MQKWLAFGIVLRCCVIVLSYQVIDTTDQMDRGNFFFSTLIAQTVNYCGKSNLEIQLWRNFWLKLSLTHREFGFNLWC